MTEDIRKLRPLVTEGQAIVTEDPTVQTVNADSVAPAANAGTPLAALLRYRIQEHLGQVYVGYFLPDPRKNGKLQLIAKTQHRSRYVAEGHMQTRALTTCKKQKVYLVQMVYSNETGAFGFWQTDADARKGAELSEHACILYRPDGTWQAL